jgi:8-oxo-dGTP pyrophosphatase MutT (NUDIX family)
MSVYQAKKGQPFHISAGALVVNEDGKIVVHKRTKGQMPEQFADNFADERSEIYLLARETVKDGESLAEAALRGVREEFGIEGTIERFLGTIVASIATGPEGRMEKTTPYFLIRCEQQGDRVMDEEGHSVLEWHDPDFLIARMRGQGGENRCDLDESKIIEAYVKSR